MDGSRTQAGSATQATISLDAVAFTASVGNSVVTITMSGITITITGPASGGVGG